MQGFFFLLLLLSFKQSLGLGKHFTSLQLLDLENDRGTICLSLFKRETTKTAHGVFFLDSTKIHESITLWAVLNPHHGVKQCFHTMDMAAYHWATLQMGPASPTSEKAAKHMKNRVILVAKHCKKKKRKK